MYDEYCPAAQDICRRGYECIRCTDLHVTLLVLKVRDRDVFWICPNCMVEHSSRKGAQGTLDHGKYFAAGFYGTGPCYECGRRSYLLQLALNPRLYTAWKEELCDGREGAASG